MRVRVTNLASYNIGDLAVEWLEGGLREQIRCGAVRPDERRAVRRRLTDGDPSIFIFGCAELRSEGRQDCGDDVLG